MAGEGKQDPGKPCTIKSMFGEGKGNEQHSSKEEK